EGGRRQPRGRHTASVRLPSISRGGSHSGDRIHRTGSVVCCCRIRRLRAWLELPPPCLAVGDGRSHGPPLGASGFRDITAPAASARAPEPFGASRDAARAESEPRTLDIPLAPWSAR